MKPDLPISWSSPPARPPCRRRACPSGARGPALQEQGAAQASIGTQKDVVKIDRYPGQGRAMRSQLQYDIDQVLLETPSWTPTNVRPSTLA